MIPQRKLTGFILKRSVFGEADRMVTVFTKERGKITLRAKGVRRIKSRRAPHLELFNYVTLETYNEIITEAKVIKNYSHHKTNLKTVGYFYYIFEIINKVLPEDVAHPEIFDYVKDFADDPIDEETVKNLMVRIIWDLGYLPHGEYPKVGVTDFLESIAERKINSKRFLDKI